MCKLSDKNGIISKNPILPSSIVRYSAPKVSGGSRPLAPQAAKPESTDYPVR